jgi:hypothetical protein
MICIFAITLRQALAEFFNRLLVGHFSPDLTPSHLTHRACRHCPMRGPDRGCFAVGETFAIRKTLHLSDGRKSMNLNETRNASFAFLAARIFFKRKQ